MTSERIDELIALAVLGELSVDEQRELDVATASDPQLAAELDEALASAAAIQRTHSEDPPQGLRNSVLEAIASTPQDAPNDQFGQSEFTATSLEPTRPDSTEVSSLDAQRSRRRFRPMLLAAAAVALFAIGGVIVIATNADNASDPIAEVMDAPDATTRPLAGEITELTVIYSASEGSLVVEGESIPVLADTATYQLWLVDDDGATSVGIFRPDDDGTVLEHFADADPTDYILGVTAEPAGGSQTPTLPILASA